MNAKGLIFAHGPWSAAHLAVSEDAGFCPPLTDTPRVLCTVSTMTGAGIEKILITVTPESFHPLRDAVRSDFGDGVQVSYLLSEKNSSLIWLIAQSNEFIAQSKVLVMTAGTCCVKQHSIKKLQDSVGRCRGTLAIRMQNACTGEMTGCDTACVMDAKSQKQLRQDLTALRVPKTLTQLADQLSEYPNFSRTNLGHEALFVDLMQDKLSANSVVDSHQIFETFTRSAAV